jgi:hypothetical protein
MGELGAVIGGAGKQGVRRWKLILENQPKNPSNWLIWKISEDCCPSNGTGESQAVAPILS